MRFYDYGGASELPHNENGTRAPYEVSIILFTFVGTLVLVFLIQLYRFYCHLK